jgi:hypothetical protein
MKDEQRQVPEADRLKDLEVRDDDASDIAGGRKKEAVRHGKSGAKKSVSGHASGYDLKKNTTT